MDDGSKMGEGGKIATNSFSKQEIEFLCKILKKKYNLNTSIHSAGIYKEFTIYIKKDSMAIFSKLVKRYMVPSLYYKLNKDFI
jgi:LAGLIDADG DNA endonuclease family